MRSLVDALRQVIRNRSLRRVEAAWLLGVAAEWAYLVTLLVAAYDAGGVVAVGLVGTLRMLPAAVLAPLLGSVTDRVPRVRVLRAVHGTRAAIAALAATWLALGLPAWLVFALAVVDGVAATLHRPTTVALLPELATSPGELIGANAATSTGEALGVLLGPAVGGAALAIGGASLGFGGAAIGFAIATFVLVGVGPRPTVVARPRAPALTELLAGVAALRRYGSARWLVFLFGAQTLVRGALTVLLVVASVELLGLGRSGVGYLTSALGAGSLIGALGAFSFVGGTRLSLIFTVSLAAWGVPIALLGLAPVPLLAFAGLAAIGVANAALDVSGFTLLVRAVPNELRGRVFGLFEGMVSLTVALGSLVAPGVIAVLGLPAALVLTGSLLPILAAVSRPVVRGAEEASVVPDRQLAVLRRVPMFAPLPLAAAERLAGALTVFSAEPGTAVVEQGDRGDDYFVVTGGHADVLVGGRAVGTVRPGDGFGEIALLRDVPRTATIVARGRLEGYRLPRAAFLEAVAGTPPSAAEAERLVRERLAGA